LNEGKKEKKGGECNTHEKRSQEGGRGGEGARGGEQRFLLDRKRGKEIKHSKGPRSENAEGKGEDPQGRRKEGSDHLKKKRKGRLLPTKRGGKKHEPQNKKKEKQLRGKKKSLGWLKQGKNCRLRRTGSATPQEERGKKSLLGKKKKKNVPTGKKKKREASPLAENPENPKKMKKVG